MVDGLRRREEAFDLPTIVEAVFDPSEDRVLYELASGESDETSRGDRLLISAGAALAAGAASAEALDRLGRRQFVVVVADPELFEDELQAELACLLRIRRRFVIVAPAGRGMREADAQLTAAGWRVADLRGRSEARLLAKALVVARYDEQPALILVDAAVALPRRLPREAELECSAGRAVDLNSTLATELRRQIASDPRLTPVVLVNDPLWQALERSDTLQTSASPERCVERGLSISVALSHAGCRPIVVAERAALAARSELLSEIAGSRRFRGVLIVLECDHPVGRGIEWPQEFEQRTLSRGLDAAGLTRTLSECLTSERAVVLQVPVEPVVTNAALASTEAGSSPVPSTADSGAAAGAGPQSEGRSAALAAGRPGSRTRTSPAMVSSSALLESAARQIREYRFNPWQQKWVDEYSAVGKRDVYLWRWTGRAVEWLTLSCVAPEWRSSVCDTKFLAAMFNVLLDDIVDERRDPSAMVDILSLMGEDPEPAVERLGCYGEFIGRVWREINRRVQEYPREPEFRRLLSYDFRQLCNQVDYSGLLHRHPHLINQTEHDLYSPHGMMVACTATLDLTCSPGFRNEDLGALREAVWHANSMARIGNLVTTWQREIGHDDFSSGVFARAVSLGWLQAGDLSSANRSAIEAVINEAGIEQEFAERWRTHRQRLVELAPRVTSVSLLGLLEGLERLLASEHASRGHK